MNVALPALVVFVLLLPGFVARSRIKRAERLSLDYSPFGQVVTEAVGWSFVLHLLWVALTQARAPGGSPWYYLLSGADFDEGDVPDFIVVSAIVDVAGAPYLYMGVLEDYFLNEEGGLDRLILQQVMRRPLRCDKLPEEKDRNLARFYPIDGDYFVLRYSEAITLNVEYVKFESTIADSSRSSETPAVAAG
jgi:hypothetical protein